MITNREKMWKLSSSILQMGERWTTKSITTTSTAANLKEIARRLIGAVNRRGKEEALEDLRWCFNSLEARGRSSDATGDLIKWSHFRTSSLPILLLV